MTIAQKVTDITSGKLTATENVRNFGKKIASKKIRDLNIFLHLNDEALTLAAEIDKRISEGKDVGKLAGICVAVKSNILVRGMETNCASIALEGFVAPYHATVIAKLLAEDAIIIGMVNMDEFACGSSGETSAFGATKNPRDPTLIPGGSSAGSAAAVAAELCDFALGSDTGGSIRNPASHCGVVGLKPTYGRVSRYGLIDLSMSFDCIGPITHTPCDAQYVLDIISGSDYFDSTSREGTFTLQSKKKLGVVSVEQFATPQIASLFSDHVTRFADRYDYELVTVDLPLDIALETYYILVYTEFFSGTRKFDGRRFGKSIDEFGGTEVQRRIMGGGEVTSREHDGRFYHEARKARTLIRRQIMDLFTQVDALVLPTVPKLAHRLGDSLSVDEMYAYDVFTVLANIAGIPAVSVPMGMVNSQPVGLQIMGPEFADEMILELSNKFIE